MPEPKAASLVAEDAVVRIEEEADPYVGRGGVKLAWALDVFAIEVAGARALDVGASTGGFTDCLLQRGAARVTALDVGYGQLHWRLRRDPRVRVIERTNVRTVDPGRVGGPFDVVTADVSFISLVTVAPALVSLGDTDTSYVLLVKPQFELGPELVGKGGIVRDPGLHLRALQSVEDGLAMQGIGAWGATPSPIRGAKGNREFFLAARPGPPVLTQEDLRRAVES